MRFLARIAWLLAVLASITLAAGSVRAQEPTSAALAVRSAQVGIGSRAKAGFWTPIWLTLQAGAEEVSGDLEIVTPDGDQTPVIYGDQPGGKLQLAAGQERQVLMYAKLGPVGAPVTIQLRRNDQVVWSQELTGLPPRLDATQGLFVSPGPDVGLTDAVRTIKNPGEAPVAVHVDKPAGLPDRWWGYDGVDALVLSTSDAAFTDALTSEQFTALRQWVELGGRLVLCVGSRGEELFAAGSKWRELLPATGVQVVPLRDRNGLELLTGSELPWDSDPFQQNRPKVTRLEGLDGVLILDEGSVASDRPLVIRVPRAFGQVVVVGLDLDHPGFAAWPGRAPLVASLVTRNESGQTSADEQTNRSVTHLGFDDLVGQLRAGLDRFPGVTLVTFTTVSVLTVLFLLLIGPGDYLLLTWLKLPRHWTWGTFALVALAFGLAAWLLGADAHGSRVRVNQAELVDLDIQTGIVRGTVWTHLYSPSAGQFDIDLAIDVDAAGLAKPAEGWLAWQGLPGSSLGGLSSRQVALATPEPYRVHPPGAEPRVAGLPVETASSKSLAARWWSQRETLSDSAASLATLSRTENGLLAGELKNPLSIDLTDAIVAYSDRMYRVKSIKAGQTIHFDPYSSELPPLDLESRLTDRKPYQDKQVTTQWPHESLDIPRIMQMLMLHEAARGSSYTGLSHRYQPYVDFSELVGSERAVLIGRSEAPAARLQIAGQTIRAEDARYFTWYRVVLPVKPQSP